MANKLYEGMLFYDLECSPMLNWTYGRFEQNAVRVEREQELLSFSYAWGDGKIRHESLANNTPKELVQKLRDLLHICEIAVAHNGKKFDNKMSNAWLARYSIPPASPFKTVDTMLMAKNVGKFSSYSLNNLCELFGIGSKPKATYADVWYDCLIHNDAKAWRVMKTYNNHDITLLRGLYKYLLPYATIHPNMGTILQEIDVCSFCGSKDIMPNGVRSTTVCTYQRYKCNGCGGWPSARTAIKDAVKPTTVNYS